MKFKKLAKGGEKGQALIIVALLMIISALIIAPMLSHVGTGLKSGKEVYEERMQLFYAADSGIEDGLWQVDNEQLETLLTGYDKYAYYDEDDTDPYQWDYTLPEVNEKAVQINLRNIWIPKDIGPPSPGDAKDIIEGVGGESPELVISGSISAISTYQIKIAYYYDDDTDPGGAGLTLSTVGIWLPPGFDYVDGSCSLGIEPATPEAYCSGLAVVWSFAEGTTLASFPGSPGDPLERSFTFQFDGPENVNPAAALSWINTSGGYTWDADVKVYKVTSTATDDSFTPAKETIVEAYTAKSKIREMGTSLSGDYCAVGNTLMKATGTTGMAPYYRNRLYKQSSATVGEFTGTGDVPPGYVPEDAHVDAAFLYWSGWIEGEETVIVIWSDDCDSFEDNWETGGNWEAAGGEFHGWGGGTPGSRELSMHIGLVSPYSLDLSGYSGREVTVSWEQREWESGWGQQLEWDDGSHWSEDFEAFHDDNPQSTFNAAIPEEYVTSEFRMRLFLDFDNTNEHCYLDNITITAPAELSLQNVADAQVNMVKFGVADNMTDVTANLSDCQIAASDDAAPGAWCYSCFYDATVEVNALITAGEVESSSAGTYILSHHDTSGGDYSFYGGGSTDYPLGTPALSMTNRYQWSYAGWSLIIIYSSPETEGHQLYIFDDFRYVKVHTTLEFPISGFLVPGQVQKPDGTWEEYAAHMTCFVGDGDEQYSGDYIALRDQGGTQRKLSDGITVGPILAFWCHEYFSNPYDNVWNGKFRGSGGGEVDGIDVDTFQIRWDDNILQEGDFSADVVLGNASDDPNDAELIMVTYIIISFRSSVTSGGTISYLVKG